MKKQRKSPTILKPVIDEETALRFASADSAIVSEASAGDSAAAKGAPGDGVEKDACRISLTISRSLYNRIAKEAARKNRTVEDHLKKHLTKRYEK